MNKLKLSTDFKLTGDIIIRSDRTNVSLETGFKEVHNILILKNQSGEIIYSKEFLKLGSSYNCIIDFTTQIKIAKSVTACIELRCHDGAPLNSTSINVIIDSSKLALKENDMYMLIYSDILKIKKELMDLLDSYKEGRVLTHSPKFSTSNLETGMVLTVQEDKSFAFTKAFDSSINKVNGKGGTGREITIGTSDIMHKNKTLSETLEEISSVLVVNSQSIKTMLESIKQINNDLANVQDTLLNLIGG